MSFLSPLFLIGATAAAVPIILHLLKRDPDVRVKFAAVKLLKHAPVEHTERHHLRELLLLALRIAALVLLALAFARPFFPNAASAASSRVTIVALDTSFSLDAPGRFDRAKQLAIGAIDRAAAGDAVGVVTFADEATIAAAPGGDRVLARAAVNEAAAGFGATRYRAALSTAAQAMGGRPGTIVLVTDLQESGWDAGDRAIVPEGATVEIADVGAMPANLAVVNVRAAGDRIVATVRNSGAAPRDARVHLAVDGRGAGEATTTVGPNQAADVFFQQAGGRGVVVTVDDPSGVQADNTRYAALGPTGAAPVAVLTGTGDLSREAFYVQHALAAGGARGYRPAGLSGAMLSTLDARALNEYVAVVMVSTRGLERRGRELLAEYVRGGGGLLLAAGPDVDGEVVGDVLGRDAALRLSTAPGATSPRVIAPADVRHPIFQPFASNAAALGLVTFRQSARVEGSACQTIARFTTGDAALLDCPAGDGRALVLASDLNNRWNDFPLHATFVPFVHEAVRYAGSGRVAASEYTVSDAPRGVARHPGIVTLPGAKGSGDGRVVAINVDARESDPARLTPDEFQSAITRMKDAGPGAARGESRQQEDRQHLWQYAIALMAIALVAEGWLAARTI